MRSAAVTLLAAATAASAQTSISFFYPSEMPTSEDFENIALSIVEVQDADHTVVAFSCVDSSTTSASSPESTSSSFDDDDSDSYYYGDSCVFVAGAMTATVGPDSFGYTYDSYDYTVTMGCTSANEAGFCTYQSAGEGAWSDYCAYSTDIDYDDDDAITSCISALASSTLPAFTTALQPSEMTTIAMPVTAGADKLSAGATATGTSARATSTTSHTSKFTVTSDPGFGATTTIGGPSSGSASATASDATPAQQTDNAAGKLRAAGAVGVVGGVVAMLAL
ncbi:hypothetical protein DBV05_g6489 [Lasiodiplodia theobromae]|uniref:Uncharacterized protein n=1 Tax=Lasiodiplodia theobromae TaxID=45133 RepID=A0A5N5DCN8_9PEZI|nr:hypothetical protein DBV05_g6489 [Lasiodiplodia theobromae]